MSVSLKNNKIIINVLSFLRGSRLRSQFYIHLINILVSVLIFLKGKTLVFFNSFNHNKKIEHIKYT